MRRFQEIYSVVVMLPCVAISAGMALIGHPSWRLACAITLGVIAVNVALLVARDSAEERELRERYDANSSEHQADA